MTRSVPWNVVAALVLAVGSLAMAHQQLAPTAARQPAPMPRWFWRSAIEPNGSVEGGMAAGLGVNRFGDGHAAACVRIAGEDETSGYSVIWPIDDGLNQPGYAFFAPAPDGWCYVAEAPPVRP